MFEDVNPDLRAQHFYILKIAQKWLSGHISKRELRELSAWFAALEGADLCSPDESNVDRVEKRLHEQAFRVFGLSPTTREG